MLSILNRIRACVFLRALVALFTMLFVAGSVVPSAVARAPKPHEEVPGDADDIGGMKDPEPNPQDAATSSAGARVQSLFGEDNDVYSVELQLWGWYWFNVLATRL